MRFTFAVDGIALVMLALIVVFVPLVILYSWHETPAETGQPAKRSTHAYFALLLALECTMIGVFAAADVFLFYVFFEVMLVPMYFLIGSFGGAAPPVRRGEVLPLLPRRRPVHARRGDRPVGARRAHLRLGRRWPTAEFSTGAERWLFLGFFLAFAIKAPFFPFHTWLPDAGGAAPAGAAALLVGVLDKVGTFGILRYCLPLFPNASTYFAPLAIALALVGIIYAALLAVGQNDLKRLVSYTSVAHFGFIGIGIFAFTTQAGSGAVLYMVNHGLATGLLFLVVGMLVTRRGSALVTRLRRRRQAGAGAGRGAPLRRSGLARAARHGAVRQRVPGADRHVHGEQDGGGRGHAGHHPGRRVRALDGAAHHAGHAEPGADAGSGRCARTCRCASRWWSPR